MKTFKNLSLALLVATAVPGMINASSEEQRQVYTDVYGQQMPVVNPSEVIPNENKNFCLEELLNAAQGQRDAVKNSWIFAAETLDESTRQFLVSIFDSANGHFEDRKEGDLYYRVIYQFRPSQPWLNNGTGTKEALYAIQLTEDQYQKLVAAQKSFYKTALRNDGNLYSGTWTLILNGGESLRGRNIFGSVCYFANTEDGLIIQIISYISETQLSSITNRTVTLLEGSENAAIPSCTVTRNGDIFRIGPVLTALGPQVQLTLTVEPGVFDEIRGSLIARTQRDNQPMQPLLEDQETSQSSGDAAY